jgi:hypothetical protein
MTLTFRADPSSTASAWQSTPPSTARESCLRAQPWRAADLINGRLLRPFTDELRLSKTYWIICPKAMTALPKIMTFRDWLLAEAARDMRQLKKLGAGTSISMRASG